MLSDGALIVFVEWAYAACLTYLVVAAAVYFAVAVLGWVQAAIRGQQSRAEDFETMAASRFTIPVSVVVPAYNEEVLILASVRSLLNLEYPEHEVVVVNDGSTDRTLALLREEYELQPLQVFYRRRLPSQKVRAIYRSRKQPRLLVVDKENGGKADALNCGVNLSRFRYVCCVDADTLYDRKALLTTMRVALQNPARVAGVTSPVAVGAEPESARHNGSGEAIRDRDPLVVFQHLDFLRAFLANRLTWSRYRFMLCVAGVFSLWRRDVVQELGGFSSDFTCEDLEFTFRAHEHFRSRREPYEILSLPELVGSSEGPVRVVALVRQRSRWQRTTLETIWAYKGMLANPRYGAVGLLGMPYLLIYEGLAPFAESVSVMILGLAWWLEIVGWQEFMLFVGIQTLGNGILTNMAVVIQDRGSRNYSLASLCGFVALGAVEFVVYRPILWFARCRGLLEFLRREKRWYKSDRNERKNVET